jgi:hypothetical protein
VDGPAPAVAAALAVLPGALGVEQQPPDGGLGVAFIVRTHDPLPVQRRIGAAIVTPGWVLLELRAEVPTLEDLFVRLVGAGGSA